MYSAMLDVPDAFLRRRIGIGSLPHLIRTGVKHNTVRIERLAGHVQRPRHAYHRCCWMDCVRTSIHYTRCANKQTLIMAAHEQESNTSRAAGSNSITRFGCFAVASTKRAAALVRSRRSGTTSRRSGRHHSSWGDTCMCKAHNHIPTCNHERHTSDCCTYANAHTHMDTRAASLVPATEKVQSHLDFDFVR